jgi:hypothetical protein
VRGRESKSGREGEEDGGEKEDERKGRRSMEVGDE